MKMCKSVIFKLRTEGSLKPSTKLSSEQAELE